jgi:hypothetical protein
LPGRGGHLIEFPPPLRDLPYIFNEDKREFIEQFLPSGQLVAKYLSRQCALESTLWRLMFP